MCVCEMKRAGTCMKTMCVCCEYFSGCVCTRQQGFYMNMNESLFKLYVVIDVF